jgi:uncharacterized surface protein with fasciclin (FAS1) repeats
MIRKLTRSFAILCAAGLLGLGVAGCQDNDNVHQEGSHHDSMHSDSNMKMDGMGMKKDIIDTATGPGMQRVTTLVTAIKAAGLVDTLKGPGPFTVFAPTNEAFAKLPAGTVENLLKPENKEKLKSILLYHVHVGDAVMAKDVKTMSLSTANGKPLMVNVDNGNVMVNNAKVIKTDVVCSNGIIHWVDTVILP